MIYFARSPYDLCIANKILKIDIVWNFFWPNVFYGQIVWSKPMEHVQGALNDHLWHDSRTFTVSGI